jgi:hypothetical protein
MFRENIRVTCGLRSDELPEGERALRNMQVNSGLLKDLNEDTHSGTALMELTSGVEESWPPTEGHGATCAGSNQVANT